MKSGSFSSIRSPAVWWKFVWNAHGWWVTDVTYLLSCDLVFVNNDPLWVQHEDIHGKPFGPHPHWMVVRNEWRGRLDHCPAGLVKHVNLIARPVGIGQHQPWPNDVESRIDMHWVGILEGDCVHTIFAAQMTPQPFYSRVVCHLWKRNAPVLLCYRNVLAAIADPFASIDSRQQAVSGRFI